MKMEIYSQETDHFNSKKGEFFLYFLVQRFPYQLSYVSEKVLVGIYTEVLKNVYRDRHFLWFFYFLIIIIFKNNYVHT